MKQLLQTLEAFDGKHAEPLVELLDGTPATEENIQALLALAEHDQPLVRAGATWVLKQWHAHGVEFSAEMVDGLVLLLGRETEWGSQLHLLQMLSELVIPQASGRQLKASTTKLAVGENKFVRAWAASTLANLADQHPSYRKAALAALAAADQDSAASVKARVRYVRKQFAWARPEE